MKNRIGMIGCCIMLLLSSAELFGQCLDPVGDVNGSGSTDVLDVQCIILTTLYVLSNEGDAPVCLVRYDQIKVVDLHRFFCTHAVQTRQHRAVGPRHELDRPAHGRVRRDQCQRGTGGHARPGAALGGQPRGPRRTPVAGQGRCLADTVWRGLKKPPLSAGGHVGRREVGPLE